MWHMADSQPEPDSLKCLIGQTKNDSLKTTHYIKLARYYYISGSIDSAVKYGKKALETSFTTKSKSLQSAAYSVIGVAYYYGGDYKNALENYLQCLKLEEQLGRKSRAAKMYNNIGALYMDQKFYDLAEKHYRKCYALYDELKDTAGLIQVNNNLGVLFGSRSQQNLDSATASRFLAQAIEHNTKTYQLSLRMADSVNLANSLANLGQNYMYQKNYKAALRHIYQSLDLEKKLGRTYDLGITLLQLGDVHGRLKEFSTAISYLQQALLIGRQISNPEIQKYAYLNLAENYAATGDFEKAFQTHKLYANVNDSIISTESTKQINELQVAFDTEKKEKENALLQEKNSSAAKTIRQQRLIGLAIGLICLLLIGFAFVIFRSNKEKQRINLQLERKNALIEKQKELVEEKQKEILDSIHYAKRIQRSLLTSEKYISRQLRRHNEPVGS